MFCPHFHKITKYHVVVVVTVLYACQANGKRIERERERKREKQD